MTNEEIEAYRPIVEGIAHRMNRRTPAHITVDELYSAGYLGLLEAEGKFDSSKGVEFKTFVSYRVKGAILDYLRGLDWVPRLTRSKGRELEAAYARVRQANGAEPEAEDVATELGLELPEFYALVNDSAPRGLTSFDGPVNVDDHGVNHSLAETVGLCDPDSAPREAVEHALGALSEVEREVIIRLYIHGDKAREIAADKGWVESRVSQIKRKSLDKMGVRLAA